jgi:foldase protein PrsA
VSRLARQLSLLSLGAVMTFAIAGCSSGGAADTSVAATVNGKKILMSEVERMINQQAQGKQAELSAHDLAQARLKVLASLIQREVLFQRAEQEKLLPTEDEISAAINKQKQDSAMTDEEFARKLKEQDMTMEALRDEAKKDIAIQKLQDKYTGKITISDREVEDYYNNNKQQFVNRRGVALAMIAVDPADNSQQGITNDAKTDADAKVKIDDVYQRLKAGEDFAKLAREKSEDASLLQGGDIGFATEEQLRQNGFPADLISQLFGPMQVGSYTSPVKFASPNSPGGRWYIFKLQEKQLQTENLTLESPNVRQQITVELTSQRKDILTAALVEVAMNESKIVNNLAADMLNNPSNLGLRPATSQAATPATGASTTGTSSPTPVAKASTAATRPPGAMAKPGASPARAASPK